MRAEIWDFTCSNCDTVSLNDVLVLFAISTFRRWPYARSLYDLLDYFQYVLSLRAYLIPVVDPAAYEPYYIISVEHNELPLLLGHRHLGVYQEVADLFTRFHAERNEPVPFLPPAYLEREREFVGIYQRNVLRLPQRIYNI